ncbi:MAG: GNAT family N-acetyltransferase [Flexilinea sp.]|nr:GNAT family N-acetyltransferase [Flexilinea sp.]
MVETERLQIYPASESQMETVISNEKDDDMKKAYTEMLEGCQNHPDQWNWFAMWMIELKDGTHIGDLCFKGLETNGTTEIGYGILDEYQGNGYATEAVKAAAAWALRDPKVTAVEAETEPDNRASQRVLEKCGFIPNGKTGEEGPRFELRPEKRPASGKSDLAIREIRENKRDYLPLLMLADEQENMIDQYLDRGTLFALEKDGTVTGVCVVTDEGDGVLEIQNLAIDQNDQGKGYGKYLIEYIGERYHDRYSVLQAGTGDSPLTVPFYERCGFIRHHIVKDHFTDHYDYPIYEAGILLKDKVYLRKKL